MRILGRISTTSHGTAYLTTSQSVRASIVESIAFASAVARHLDWRLDHEALGAEAVYTLCPVVHPRPHL